MKLKQRLIVFLCFIMVLGTVSCASVLAEEPQCDTIEKVLGVEAISSLNDWSFANSTMTTYTRGGYHSIQSPDGAVYTSEGLDLRNTNGVDYWRFSAFRSWSPVSMSSSSFRAVYFKVKGDVSMVVKTPDNYSIVKLDSAPGTSLSSMTTSTGATAVREVTHDLTVDNDWVEYLMVPRNTNAVYLWAKSTTLTDGEWVKVMGLDRYYYTSSSSEDYQTNREKGISFSGSGIVAGWKTIDFNLEEGNSFQQDARTVVLSDEDVKPEGADCLWFEEEFLKEPEYPNHSFGNGIQITGDGAAHALVKYANSAEGIPATGGAITFSDLEIPVDGYAEFKLKSNGIKRFRFDDGNKLYELTLNCDYSAIPGTVALAGGYIADSDASWRTWRVVRSANGYSLYSQTEGDSGWRIHAMDGFSKETAGNGEKISLVFYGNCDGASDGNGKLDYLRIYGPAPKNGLVMTDGYSTKVVDSKNELSSLDSAYVLAVRSPEAERKLIFAKYGMDDVLIDIKVVDVPMGTGAISVPYDLTDEEGSVRCFKILLWDDFSQLVPISQSISVKGNLTIWQDAWERGGNALVENETIVLDSKSGVSSFAEWKTDIPDAFDISWTMEIESYGDEEAVSINTGSHLVSLSLSANEISYQTNTGTKTTPWAIGNKKHRYRLLHQGGSCHLLIDGYYVDVLEDVTASLSSPGIRFENQGGLETESVMRIEPVTVAAYREESVPEHQGFYHTFESAEESAGWKFIPTAAADGEGEVSAWEINDGNLQLVDFRTRAITSVAQRYFPESVGDDYIFMARMQIPSFGTSGMLNIYLPYRALVLDLKQMFFGMSSDASALAASNSSPSTVYSDPIMIDTSKWFDLRIETFDYCNKVRIFIDDEKIMEGELSESTLNSRVVDLRSQSDWSEPFATKYDWFKCAPITYGVTVRGISDGDVISGGTSVSLSAVVNGTAEEEVTYQLSGNVVATGTGANHSATLSGLSAGTYELTAVCGNKFSAPISFVVEDNETEEDSSFVTADSNFANEVSYEATGDGTVSFSNGNHLLKMIHSDGMVTYQTDEGTKAYESGQGSFRVITEGPVAEVYRNGQFVFSFYMPISHEKEMSFEGNVIGEVTPSPERKTYFSANGVVDRKKVYQLSELPYNHVIDFIADGGDNVHLVLNDGYYRTNLSLENGEIYVWDGQRNNSLAAKTKVGAADAGEAYYRIETSVGMSRLYKNGRWLAAFRGAPTIDKGTFAVNVSSGALEYLAVCDNVDLYLYEDDFSGDGDLESEEYWKLSNGMKVSADEERGVLCLESSKADGIAEISTSCGNAELSAQVTMESGDGFWFVANRATEGSYTKVGYNFQTGKYEIVDVITTATKVGSEYQKNFTENVVQSKTATLTPGESVSLKLKVQETGAGKEMSLFVNGTRVLSGISEFYCRGPVGFMLSSGTALVESVAFRGDGKLMLGVTEYVLEGSLMMDMIENFETGEVYMLNSAGVGVATRDGGKTWIEKKITNPVSNHLYQFYQNTELNNGTEFSKGDILSVSKAGNGTINGVNMKDDYGQALYAQFIQKSSDYGQSWNRYSTKNYFFPSLEEVKESRDSSGATVNAFKRGYSGRFYYVGDTGGNEDYGGAKVWYSDNAKSWTLSETKILSKDLGFVIAEAQVLDTSKFTRLYFRTDLGSIGYFESFDHGKTWDLTPHKTPFISVASCFNIEADPLNPDTIYIAWIYDNSNLFARHQFPRMRWGVAKSVDGGENWEMLGTVHENTSAYHENSNMTLSVSSDYVFVSAQSSEYYRAVSPMNTRIVAFPKDSQRTSKRFEQLHLQYPEQVENTQVMLEDLAERTMVIHPESGVVWLKGKRFDSAYKGNYILLECAAKLVGAKVRSIEDGSAILELGNAEIPFYTTELSDRNGKKFVSLLTFAERFNLKVSEEEDGIILVSENQDWSKRQKKAFRYAVDLFSLQP